MVLAYAISNEVTILQAQKPAKNYSYVPLTQPLNQKENKPQLAEVALAHPLWGCLAYDNQWYQPFKLHTVSSSIFDNRSSIAKRNVTNQDYVKTVAN
ncbi:MAG: hypothetical protein ACSHW0_07925 [Thalassotalea sp.]